MNLIKAQVSELSTGSTYIKVKLKAGRDKYSKRYLRNAVAVERKKPLLTSITATKSPEVSRACVMQFTGVGGETWQSLGGYVVRKHVTGMNGDKQTHLI